MHSYVKESLLGRRENIININIIRRKKALNGKTKKVRKNTHRVREWERKSDI